VRRVDSRLRTHGLAAVDRASIEPAAARKLPLELPLHRIATPSGKARPLLRGNRFFINHAALSVPSDLRSNDATFASNGAKEKYECRIDQMVAERPQDSLGSAERQDTWLSG